MTKDAAAENILHLVGGDGIGKRLDSCLVNDTLKGYHLDEICIGNMSTRQGAKQIKKTVYVTEEDKKDFLELSKLGVKLYLQEKPTDGKEDIVNLL